MKFQRGGGIVSTVTRVIAASAAVIVIISLGAAPARTQTCTHVLTEFALSLSIPGFPGGGNYIPACFSWGPTAALTGQGISNELSFTTSVDSSIGDLVSAAQSGQILPSAELQQTLVGTVTIDIQMSNVQIASVAITGDDSDGPQRTVTLKFSSVTVTFQPVLPNGQKAGPPVTFSASFKK